MKTPTRLLAVLATLALTPATLLQSGCELAGAGAILAQPDDWPAVRLIDLETGEMSTPVRNLLHHTILVGIAPDGKSLWALRKHDPGLLLLRLDSKGDSTERRQLKTPGNVILTASSMHLSPDASLAAWWDIAGMRLRIFDTNTGQEKASIERKNRGLPRIEWLSNRELALLDRAKGDQAPELWRIAVDTQSQTLLLRHEGLLLSRMEPSPDGSRIALVGGDRARSELIVLDSSTGKILRRFHSLSRVTALSWSSDGGNLAYIDGPRLCIHELETNRTREIHTLESPCRPSCIAISKNRVVCISGKPDTQQKQLLILEADSGKVLRRHEASFRGAPLLIFNDGGIAACTSGY